MAEDNRKEGLVPAATRTQPVPSAPVDLESLYREHHALVLACAYRVTGDSAEAEDVLQTVFMRLLNRQECPDLSPSPGAYLKRSAINAAIDVVRRRRDSKRVSMETVEPFLAEGPSTSPEQRQREAELKSWLRGALGRLSPSAAEVFTLHFIEGMDHQAIATALDMTTNAVAVLLHRARKQLRADLEGAKGDSL